MTLEYNVLDSYCFSHKIEAAVIRAYSNIINTNQIKVHFEIVNGENFWLIQRFIEDLKNPD